MDDNTRRSFLKRLGIASVMATKRIRRVFASNLADIGVQPKITFLRKETSGYRNQTTSGKRLKITLTNQVRNTACFRIRLRSVSRH